ncbi:response regulator transcription factor [Nesterenkonia halophila]|uniref:response regulator transcription factor n=1 Tax=Nesterenkonia halophila TaxID=302044 RepID=UPI001290E096|nr:response regulator transcription factor [Nesterenkonia halophila]
MSIRVLIVDDQDLVRAGLRTLLSGGPREEGEPLDVVGEALDGDDALRRVERLRPEVVLMDLRMPGLDGIAATRAICAREDLADVRVVVLTTFDDDADILAAVRAGAAGYLLKDTPAARLREGVRTAASGGNLLSPMIARRLMEHLADGPPGDDPDDQDGGEGEGAGGDDGEQAGPSADLSLLTGREIEVLAEVARGRSNAEAGAALNLSPETARTYVSRMLHKLGARDRTELAILARRAGLHRREHRGHRRRR